MKKAKFSQESNENDDDREGEEQTFERNHEENDDNEDNQPIREPASVNNKLTIIWRYIVWRN